MSNNKVSISFTVPYCIALLSTPMSVSASATQVTEPVTITATRFPASIPTTASDISIISNSDIQRSSTHTISQVLETLGGVHIDDLYGISGSKSSVDLGGFGATGSLNTLILLNGRRLNDVDLSGANLAAIPLENVEKIEIVRGTSTVLYGDNAVGGVINIVTKTGFDNSKSTIRLMNGSYDTTKFNTSMFTADGNNALAYSLEYFDSSGYRDNSGFKNINSFFDLTHQTQNGITGMRVQASNEALKLPGEINETTFLTNPTASNGLAQSLDEKQQSIEAYYNEDSFAAEWSYRDKDQAGKLFGDTFAHLSTRSLTPRMKRQYQSHHLIFGVDWYASTLATLADFGFARNSSQARRHSTALYITDNYAVSNAVDISLGLRRQKISLDLGNDDQIANVLNAQSNNISKNAREITVSYNATERVKLYLKNATGFRFPVLDEMWDYFYGTISLLNPQTSHHTELGAKAIITTDTTLQASLFHIKVENEIVFDATKYNNVNLPDPTQHDGINLQLNHIVEGIWHIHANYNARRAVFSEGSNQDKFIPLVPQSKFSLSQQFELSSGNSVSLDTLYTGKRYFGDDFSNNGKTLPSYTMVNLGFKKAHHNWQAGVSIHNLTDKRVADIGYYREYFSVPYVYYPLPERSFYLELGIEL